MAWNDEKSFMDIGPIGAEDIVFKRKFRWTLEFAQGTGLNQPDQKSLWYALVTKRPTLTIEETPIHHMHETHYLSGKPKWETMNLTVYDVKQAGVTYSASGSELAMHKWLNAIFSYSKSPGATWNLGTHGQPYEQFDMGSSDKEYKQDILLKLYDGHGAVMETWVILGAFATSTNWQDLDYNSNDTANIEMTLRYDRAEFWPTEYNYATAGASDIA